MNTDTDTNIDKRTFMEVIKVTHPPCSLRHHVGSDMDTTYIHGM